MKQIKVKGAFKVGDVVRLKSGGPKMTVQRVDLDPDHEDGIDCVWFNATAGEYTSDNFAPEILDRCP